jgi:hypothetical protein
MMGPEKSQKFVRICLIVKGDGNGILNFFFLSSNISIFITWFKSNPKNRASYKYHAENNLPPQLHWDHFRDKSPNFKLFDK